MHDYLVVFLNALLPYAAQAVATVLGLVGIWLLKVLGEKFKVDAQGQLNATVWDGAQRAAAYAEEWANKQIKLDPTKLPPGAAKMQVALDFLQSQVSQNHLDKIGQDKLTAWIESALHVTRPDMSPVTPRPAPTPLPVVPFDPTVEPAKP